MRRKKFFDFVKTPPTSANAFCEKVFCEILTNLTNHSLYTLCAFRTDFVRSFLFRYCLRIVCSWLYAVRRICIEVAVSSTNMEFFVKKNPNGEYISVKIDDKQRTVYSSTFALFSQTIFCSVKKWFRPLFVVFVNSVCLTILNVLIEIFSKFNLIKLFQLFLKNYPKFHKKFPRKLHNISPNFEIKLFRKFD